MLRRRRVLAAKVESTPGTAESLSASEAAFRAYDVKCDPTVSIDERERQGTLAQDSPQPGTRLGKMTFKTDFYWDGTATLPSWATVLLPGCGYVNNSGTITPRSEGPGSNVKTLTLAAYIDGVVKKIAGAVGNFKIAFGAGKVIVIDWEFTGVYADPTDTALLSPTYPTAPGLRYANATTQLNDVDLAPAMINFDAGNQIQMLESGATSQGYSYGVITSRKPKLSLDPLAVLVASQDRFAALKNATQWAWELDITGPSASTFTLDAPKAQVLNMPEGDRGGVITDQLELALCANTTADTDVQLIFTAGS